jgi:hypothetical protein
MHDAGRERKLNVDGNRKLKLESCCLNTQVLTRLSKMELGKVCITKSLLRIMPYSQELTFNKWKLEGEAEVRKY